MNRFKDYTKNDLIKLFNLNNGKCYFDIINDNMCWTNNISKDELNYYYGSTIYKIGSDLYAIGFIFQDRSMSNRDIILHYSISKDEYDTLYTTWLTFNKNKPYLNEYNGYKVLPEGIDDMLCNEINKMMIYE